MTHSADSSTTSPTVDSRVGSHPGDLSTGTPVPTPSVSDVNGIGDIALAGRQTGYAHLRPRDAPTTGRTVAAAREAAAVLARPALRPSRRGRWQRAPRPARRRAGARMRVTVVALEPNDFVSLPSLGSRGSDVLHLARGHAHTVVSAPNGEMRAVQELATGRTRVVGASGHRRLINTGTSTAVVVRVTGT